MTDTILVVALAVSWALLGFQGWLLYLLIRQHGKALIAQEELRGRLAAVESVLRAPAVAPPAAAVQPAQPQPLALGTPAPEFSLPDLEGRQRRLADFAGKPLLLLFFDPGCGFCGQLAPELGRLTEATPQVVLVSRGEVATHRALAREHGWRCDVLIEPAWEVATAYGTSATPTGYLIDARGTIASTLAVGVPGILDLARAIGGGIAAEPAELTAEALKTKETAAGDRARAAGLAVTESRIAREGLAAGTPAPDFRLPDLAGQERSLSDYRGRKVLLVFSDPGCAPCQTLTPELEAVHRAHASNGLQVLMVGRGDAAANRAKAEEHGVTFPVVLQRQWEVSREYAMFATPIGYLVGAGGTIEKDVAIGSEAILELAR